MFNINENRDSLFIIFLRILLGSIFMLASLEQFSISNTNFIPESANKALMLISEGKLMVYIIATLQFFTGSMIAFNFLVPLALTVLSPIILSILIYSATVNPVNLLIAVPLVIITMCLFYFYRKVFKVFLKMQLYSSPTNEKTCKIIIIEEVEEKLPHELTNLNKIYSQVS
jgi:hypothetical protein